MNKIVFLFTAAALALTSCSQEEVVNDMAQQNNAIEFGTYAGRPAQTRAASVTPKSLESFGVFADYTKAADLTFDGSNKFIANFMKNQEVEKQGDDWTYSPVKYWPNTTGHKVSFWAYAPYNDGAKLNDDGKSFTIPFTLGAVGSQTDLLYSNNLNGINGTFNKAKQNTTEKVTFNFAHALARIGFTAQYAVNSNTVEGSTLDAHTKISITKVKLTVNTLNGEEKGFASSGNLNVTLAKTTDAYTATPSWTPTPGSVIKNEFELSSNNLITAPHLTSTSNNAVEVNNSDSYIMVIPQDLEGTTFKIEVEYDVITSDDKLEGWNSTIHNTITTDNIKGINFVAGKAYTFNLIIGLTSVKVAATAENWTSVVPYSDVYVPKNTEPTGGTN